MLGTLCPASALLPAEVPRLSTNTMFMPCLDRSEAPAGGQIDARTCWWCPAGCNPLPCSSYAAFPPAARVRNITATIMRGGEPPGAHCTSLAPHFVHNTTSDPSLHALQPPSEGAQRYKHHNRKGTALSKHLQENNARIHRSEMLNGAQPDDWHLQAAFALTPWF